MSLRAPDSNESSLNELLLAYLGKKFPGLTKDFVSSHMDDLAKLLEKKEPGGAAAAIPDTIPADLTVRKPTDVVEQKPSHPRHKLTELQQALLSMIDDCRKDILEGKTTHLCVLAMSPKDTVRLSYNKPANLFVYIATLLQVLQQETETNN